MSTYPQQSPRINLAIVKFCAEECKLQHSNDPLDVWRYVAAWEYGMAMTEITERDIKVLAYAICPISRGQYRDIPVTVNGNVIGYQHIERQMGLLVTHLMMITPIEFFTRFQEIHPFVDGNGRVGQLLYNWILASMNQPQFAPDPFGQGPSPAA